MTAPSQPHVRSWAGPYLRVDGAPFLVVGAEVHNSSTSSPAAIRRSFTTVKRLGVNTVLAPVAWDQLEPAEGRYDFTLIETMIGTARELGLRLVPLWFGTWKNAVSTYAPAWVKVDSVRFPRAQLSDGRRVEHVSAFSTQARDADARAFSAMMARIHAVDGAGLVIAVQVENEVGLLGDSRDRCGLAVDAFARSVPVEVFEQVAADVDMPLHDAWVRAGSPMSGTWQEAFAPGDAVDEAFMAAAFAGYVGAVAAAGAAELDVPLFANAWLNEHSALDGPVALAGGKRPGEYPSGGPVLTVAPIWEALAPALDLLAPDVYVDDADDIFAGFARRRARLLIPELRADARGIAQMFLAVGKHRALGVSPFGVDACDPGAAESLALVDAFGLLSAIAVLIRRSPDATIHGFLLDEATPSSVLRFDAMTLAVEGGTGSHGRDPAYPAYGAAIQDGRGVFVIGRGFDVRLVAPVGGHVSFLSAVQYESDGGQLSPVLRLNGDETGGGTSVPFPFAGAPRLTDRLIPIKTPDTGIVRVEAYTY